MTEDTFQACPPCASIKAGTSCDCVMKLYRKGGPIYTAVEKASRKIEKASRNKRSAEQIATAKAALETDATLLTDSPSQVEWVTAKGQTLRDSVMWLFANAGQAGKLKAATIVEKSA